MTNLEKLKQNLESIEEGLFDKFVEECEAQGRKPVETYTDGESDVNDPHYIMGSFVWIKTKQGHDYWFEMDQAYSELIKKQRIENQ